MFSAESDPRKRAWIDEITKLLDPEDKSFIFDDVSDLSRQFASCFRQGLVRDIPLLLAKPFLFMAGPSCRIVSALHTSGSSVHLKHRTIIDGLGSTGL